MKIQTKLICAFGVVVLITLSVALLGYWQVSKLGGALYEVGVVRLPSIEGLNMISEARTSLEASERILLLPAADSTTIETELKRQQAAWQMVDRGWALYEPLPQTAQEAEKWKAFVPVWKAWRTEYTALTDLLTVSQNSSDMDLLEQARKKSLLTTTGLSNRAAQLLTEITEINRQIVVEAKQRSVSKHEDVFVVQRLMLITAGLAVLMAVVVGLVIGRLISRPVVQVADALARVTKGDLNAEILVNSHDEIGHMAEAMNGMIKSLRTSEARLQSLADNLPNGMVYQIVREDDGRMRFVYVSAGVKRLNGLTPEEIMRDSSLLYALIVEEDRAKVLAAEQHSIETMSVFNAVVRQRRRDGELRWMQLRSAPRALPDGRILWDGIALDITDRQRAEEALRESEEKYRGIFENAIQGIFRSTPEGRYLSVNPSLARMVGYDSPEEMIRSITDAATQIFADPHERSRLVVELEQHGFINNQEIQIRRRDGQLIWVLINIRAVRDASGRSLYYEGTNIDITERKHLLEMQEAKFQAEAANRAKSAFLANMSHEIRTPMNAILGFSQLLMRDAALSPQQRDYLDVIDRNGEHLMALINDILEMSKIEANRTTLNPTAFNLHALGKDMESMFRARAETKGLAFTVDFDPGLPALAVGDAGKLRQIFFNLLGNAVKFTSVGRITLRLRAEPQDDRSWLLWGEVADTGPGIPAAELHRLFKHFEQTELGRSSGTGTGLGLAISREFARMMDGDITVESHEGMGTVFRLHVLLASAGPDALISSSRESMPPHAVRLAAQQPECRVLVVDDLADSRRFLHQLLVGAGFVVREAGNGAEAVVAYENWQPHCILMDLRMPIMSGLEATREIRRREKTRQVKIICLTASAFLDDREQVIAAGMDAFMTKPVHAAELFAQLQQQLGLTYGQHESDTSPGKQPPGPLPPASGLAMPPEIARQLRRAVEEADLDQVLVLADELGRHNAEQGERVRRLAQQFEYGMLLSLLDSNPTKTP